MIGQTKPELRFLGSHRCPRCRMPLGPEEIACPACELEIVFVNARGEVMVQMIAADGPGGWGREELGEYLTMLEVEGAGDMYMPRRHLPVRPQRADLVRLPGGALGVRFANLVPLDSIRRPDLERK